MTLNRLILLAGLFLVCSHSSRADQELQDQETKSLDVLKKVMESNVAALGSGCIVDSKWLFSTRKGPRLPLNSERSFRIAIQGEDLLVESWYSGRYDPATKTMVATREEDSRAAFGGIKYIQTDGDRYLVSKNPANIGAIFDAFQAYPLTAMFAFLVPGQGYVTYGNVASPSTWSAYLADITHVSYDNSGNMVVSSLRADGIAQEVTFSAAYGFYPSKIKVSWADNESITQVVDWAKTDVFGNGLQFVPKTITCQGGKKGKDPLPVFKITLDAQSITKVPEIAHYFNLPVASGSPIHDMDVSADVKVP